MALKRTREEFLDLVDRVESLMLMGYDSTSSVKRALAHFDVSFNEAKDYMGYVRNRWNRGASSQDKEQQRASVLQMYKNVLREAYSTLRVARDSMSSTALGEQNRAIANIARILSNIADLEGLNERAVKVSGSLDTNPIQVNAVKTQIIALEGMIDGGYIDSETFKAIESAILSRNGSGEEVIGSIREIDTNIDTSNAS